MTQKQRTVLSVIAGAVGAIVCMGLLALAVGPLAAGYFCLGALVLLGLLGIRQVKQEERMVIELFGKYYRTLKPGLNWIFPWIMKTRAAVSTWELILPLFENPIKIDFMDGSAVPQGAEVFVKMCSPDTAYSVESETPRDSVYRAIYEVANWREAIKDLVENAVRSFFNRLTLDEALKMGKGGYDLANHNPDIGLPNDELARIEKALDTWGFELKRITVQDFDLDPDLVKARDQVQVRQKEAEAARFVAQRRAEESLGAIMAMLAKGRGKTTEEIAKEIDKSPKLRKELLELVGGLVSRQMSLDANALSDIRVDGADGIEASLLRLISLWKQTPTGGERSAKEDT